MDQQTLTETRNRAVVESLQGQRNAALDQVASMAGTIKGLAAQNADLLSEIARMKAASKPEASQPAA